MTKPTSAPFFSLAMMNPFMDPAEAAVYRFHPTIATNPKYKAKAIAIYQKGTPALLRNKALRILIVSVIYLAGLIFIPIILRFTYFNKNISSFKAKIIIKKNADIDKATALRDERIAQRSLEPSAGNIPPNHHVDMPRDPEQRPKADSTSPVPNTPNGAAGNIQSPPPPAGYNTTQLETLSGNIFTAHREKRDLHQSTLRFYKTPVEQAKIFEGLNAIRDLSKKLEIIDKLLYIEDLVFDPSSEIRTFISTLKRVAYTESMTLTKSHQAICAPQDIYTDTSCKKGEANGCCGSSALAFLAGSSDPISDGFTMHLQYGFKPITKYADLTDDLIEKNLRVHLHKQHKKINDNNLDFPILNRYNGLLQQIPLETKGLLQVGGKFLAIEKHRNGTVELFDSHGKPYPHSLDKTHDMSKAYSATFQNSQDAALFLSVNRRPNANPNLHHVIEFIPIQFSPDTTADNLKPTCFFIDNVYNSDDDSDDSRSPRNLSSSFLHALPSDSPDDRERSDSVESFENMLQRLF